MTEFDIYQEIEDGYSVEDVLAILGITPQELYRDYLCIEIEEHKNDLLWD